MMNCSKKKLLIVRTSEYAMLDSKERLMKRNTEILQLPQAPQQSVASLLNWINSTGSIVRKKTTFLHDRDLCAVGDRKDHGIAWIESIIERTFIYFYRILIFSRQPSNQAEAEGQYPISTTASYNKQIFLFEGPVLHVIAHLCFTTLIVLFMLTLVIVTQAMISATMQTAFIMLMSVCFTVVISGPVNARTAEIFGPSATYEYPFIR